MAYTLITNRDSPNFTRAASVPAIYGGPRTIDAITIHHWGVRGQRFEKVVDYLCRSSGKTSAHEVIEAGRVAVIVNHRDAAWHSGSSKGNRTTIGLELRPEATAADYATAAERIADLRAAYGNLPLIPHRAWKATACPGVWDLARLDREARAVKTTAIRNPANVQEDDMEIHELIDFRVDGRNIWDSLKDIYRFTQTSRDLAAQQTAQITALTAAVTALATSKGVDPAQAQAAVTRAVDAALADLTITLTAKES